MKMNIDDVLNDSKEYGQVDDNVSDTLKAILAGQKAIMDIHLHPSSSKLQKGRVATD